MPNLESVAVEGWMPIDKQQKEGAEVLLMGNEAIARGALEAGLAKTFPPDLAEAG